MISFQDALRIHEVLIDEFGGGKGVRDVNALKSALKRPFSTFDGEDLYPTIIEKSGAILESILVNHPFVDGNKRTGYVLMRMMLLSEGINIDSSQDDKFEFVLKIAKGEMNIELIIEWIKERITI